MGDIVRNFSIFFCAAFFVASNASASNTRLTIQIASTFQGKPASSQEYMKPTRRLFEDVLLSKGYVVDSESQANPYELNLDYRTSTDSSSPACGWLQKCTISLQWVDRLDSKNAFSKTISASQCSGAAGQLGDFQVCENLNQRLFDLIPQGAPKYEYVPPTNAEGKAVTYPGAPSNSTQREGLELGDLIYYFDNDDSIEVMNSSTQSIDKYVRVPNFKPFHMSKPAYILSGDFVFYGAGYGYEGCYGSVPFYGYKLNRTTKAALLAWNYYMPGCLTEMALSGGKLTLQGYNRYGTWAQELDALTGKVLSILR